MKRRAELLYQLILKEVVEPIVGSGITRADTLHEAARRILGDKFTGVGSADMIPILSNKRPYCILNLDDHDEPGSHWIGVVFKNGTNLVYDSFGRRGAEIIRRLKNIKDTELDAEQSVDQTNCGARTLSFLILADRWGIEMAKHI